jgi:hypothetical protein
MMRNVYLRLFEFYSTFASEKGISMLQVIIIASIIVGLSLVLLGINIYVFGKKFPETEVGKNRNMIRLGLRCPHCEERAQYRKLKPVKVDLTTLQPDWKAIKH